MSAVGTPTGGHVELRSPCCCQKLRESAWFIQWPAAMGKEAASAMVRIIAHSERRIRDIKGAVTFPLLPKQSRQEAIEESP